MTLTQGAIITSNSTRHAGQRQFTWQIKVKQADLIQKQTLYLQTVNLPKNVVPYSCLPTSYKPKRVVE